ncbi:MAG: sugar ABC transporter permease [Candidatus Enteromonas sp.]|nr:sugar ABC transporter permease [Candidatus Enteromonas sp.]
MKTTKKKKRNTWQENLFILSCVLIPVVNFLVFYVYVNLDAFAMAFQKPIAGGQIIWTFDNFAWVFDKIFNGSRVATDNLRLAFGNTFLTFFVQICMFVVGLFVSYFLYKKILGYKFFRIIFFLPSILSAVVTTVFYSQLMNNAGFQHFLTVLFHLDYELNSPLMDSSFANGMVLMHLIWLSFPSNMILWGGTFSRIPDAVLESARIDGANWVRELFQIILPIVWPTFVILITTQAAGIFGASGSVFLLTGGQYGTQTVSNWIYTYVQTATGPNSGNLYRAATLGFCLTVVSCGLALGIRYFLNHRVEEVEF